jgi:hypothetical protein
MNRQPIGCMMSRPENELTMIDIQHRIGIKAPQERVHQALATTEGEATPFPGELQISSWG